MKKHFKTLSIIILFGVILSSCADIFYSPDAYTLAEKQETIAIMPPSVSIKANDKVEAEALKEQQKTESVNFQKEMYSWLLKRKGQGRFSPDIQDIETTNALLKKAGYPETPLTSAEMCEVLKVDAILKSNYSLSKPMSEGAAFAAALVFGVSAPTNEVDVSLSINDCSNNKMIWNYSHTYSGSIGSSPGKLVDNLLRHASKKMPYKK